VGNIQWSFAGQTAIVTGASRGIGLATANLLASAGANVFALSRSGDDKELHPAATALRVDVSDRTILMDAVGRAALTTGRVEIAVANAGVGLVEEFSSTDPAEWRRLVDVNLLGAMNTCQAVLPYMLSAGGRLIVNSSAAGVRGEMGTPTYSATKAALMGLVQSLAIEYAPRGVTVNAVAPGEIDTELNRAGRQRVAEQRGRSATALLDELVSSNIPAGRLGTPDEVARVIAFLASEEAAYITGQTVIIDGGQLLI